MHVSNITVTSMLKGNDRTTTTTEIVVEDLTILEKRGIYKNQQKSALSRLLVCPSDDPLIKATIIHHSIPLTNSHDVTTKATVELTDLDINWNNQSITDMATLISSALRSRNGNTHEGHSSNKATNSNHATTTSDINSTTTAATTTPTTIRTNTSNDSTKTTIAITLRTLSVHLNFS